MNAPLKFTQAQLWAMGLQGKTNNLGAMIEKSKMTRIMFDLRADYPHRIEQVYKDKMIVGCRRIFGDNSHATTRIDNPLEITTGVMLGGKAS